MEPISDAQCDLLIKHLDGQAVPIDHTRIPHQGTRQRGLVARGYLRYDRTPHPRATYITEEGRELLATILGKYADAIARAVRAGLPMALPLPVDSGTWLTPGTGQSGHFRRRSSNP